MEAPMSDLTSVVTTLRAELSARYSTDEITPDTWWLSLSRTALGAVALLPAMMWLRQVIDVLDAEMASRSVCLPKIGGEGAVIVYSAAALADPIELIETVAHEHEHARVLKADPDLQVAMDYTSGELRATTEARAYAVGAFARYLVTGAWQTADEIVAPLAHGYLLSPADREHVAALIASHLASMRAGVVPPLEVCHVVLEILRAKHPGAIVVEAFR
jgi:hypothetical protein